MRSIFLLLSFVTILFANTRIIPIGSPIPHDWICVSIDPRGYTVKELTVVSTIENWKSPYDKLIIQKVKEKSHKMRELPSVP